jgi:hypothetical protein
MKCTAPDWRRDALHTATRRSPPGKDSMNDGRGLRGPRSQIQSYSHTLHLMRFALCAEFFNGRSSRLPHTPSVLFPALPCREPALPRVSFRTHGCLSSFLPDE